MGIQVGHLLCEAFRMAHIIGIHTGDGGATGMGQTGVQRVGDADARFVEEGDPWITCRPLLRVCRTVIGARVIDQQ